jgi:hypothetical protein
MLPALQLLTPTGLELARPAAPATPQSFAASSRQRGGRREELLVTRRVSRFSEDNLEGVGCVDQRQGGNEKTMNENLASIATVRAA